MRSSPWQAYAKALHYREMEFRSEPHVEAAIESLISINNQLQQPDAFLERREVSDDGLVLGHGAGPMGGKETLSS